MVNPRSFRLSAFALGAALLAGAHVTAQTTVSYPDDQIVQPPQLLFPFYTLGGGGVVRYQTMCPATFAGLPSQPMIVTGFGLQLADQALYSQFEVRFGTTDRTTLSNTWAANLPDQRVQKDLSGTVLQGGAGVNQWVEYDIDFPFVWTPGESITFDVVSSAAAPGSWCSTGVGTHERLYDAPYMNLPTGATVSPTNGLKFRILMEPLGFPTYGQGCAGNGGFVPSIDVAGSSQLGNSFTVNLSQADGGNSAILMFGASRTQAVFGALPFSVGGACALLTSSDASVFLNTTGTGAGNGSASYTVNLPASSALDNSNAFLQWVQPDFSSPTPIVTSAGAVVPLYQ